MKVISAEFVTSAAAGGGATGIPNDGLPQVAMAGRSNVGKSTLINALARRPIARTSAAPGKTRLANIYRLTLEGGMRRDAGHGAAGRWSLYLVDLPGYGYARGGAGGAEELKAVAEAYFRERAPIPGASSGITVPVPGTQSPPGTRVPVPGTQSPPGTTVPVPGSQSPPGTRVPVPGTQSPPGTGTLLLVDSRHPGLESDIQAHGWLATLGVEPVIVATKVDKLSRAERTRNLKEIERIFGNPALPVSAERGEGMDQLWKTIASKARAAERSLRADE